MALSQVIFEVHEKILLVMMSNCVAIERTTSMARYRLNNEPISAREGVHHSMKLGPKRYDRQLSPMELSNEMKQHATIQRIAP